MCEEARCPNIGECWGGGEYATATATIMVRPVSNSKALVYKLEGNVLGLSPKSMYYVRLIRLFISHEFFVKCLGKKTDKINQSVMISPFSE